MKRRAFPLLFLATTACLALPAFGKYAQPELKDVPLERLLANLTERAKTDPADAAVLHDLARTHAMAYASKLAGSTPVKSWSGWNEKGHQQPWFGFEPPHVPYNKVAEAPDPDSAAAAKAHLASAIESYKKALAISPDDPTITLGLAWCQDQAGDKAEATALYRKVAAKAWETESKSGGGLGNFLFVETAGYLKNLLDPTKDAKEIAELDERSKTLLALPRAVTPLIVPVGKSTDLNSLVDHDARVPFDLDGSGRLLKWPWITKDAAWLVFDPRHTGKITSSIQMFGSRSFLLFCADGYHALALLDDNRDGILSGPELVALALWNDLDSDGISDPGEVKPLSAHGITALSTKGQTHPSGIPFSPAGATLEDGSTRPTYDLILQSE